MNYQACDSDKIRDQASATKAMEGTSDSWATHSKRVKEIVGCLDHIQSTTLHLGFKLGHSK